MLFQSPSWVSSIRENPKEGLKQKTKGNFMKNKKQTKQVEQSLINRGLAFVPFHKVRKTKNGTNVLIYLNSGSAISVSIKYLLKVLENGEG